MQAQYQLDVYTEHKVFCLASNISAKIFFHTQSILNISTVKHVPTPVDNLTYSSSRKQSRKFTIAFL